MKKKNYGFDVMGGLLLICAFAACLFFTLAAGAGIYKDVSAVMDEQYGARTAMGYVTAKLHQADALGRAELSELDGVPALLIREELDGVAYTTFIYCCDGYISELFCPATEKLAPSDGLPVIPAEELKFSANGSLLRIDCTTAAGTDSAYVGLVSGLGGAK
ncbi:MAG: DUF4860 domain-containing protein [Oscillospiraceae bacterium]